MRSGANKNAGALPATARLAGLLRHAVARAEGISIAPGAGDTVLMTLDSVGHKNPRWRPSLLHDLDAGRRLELEDLVGVIVHKGVEHGIATPVIRVCYMMLKPYEMGIPRL
jgi:ketopantoate reductase